MYKLVIFAITMLLLSSICNGQGVSNFGATRAQDTSRTVAQVKFTAYGGSLDTMLMIVMPNGDVKKVAKNQFGNTHAGYGLLKVGNTIYADTSILIQHGGNYKPFGLIIGNAATSLELIGYGDTRFLIESDAIKVFNVDSFLILDNGALRAAYLVSDDGGRFAGLPSVTMLGTTANGTLTNNNAIINGKVNYSDTLTSIATKTNIAVPTGAVVFGSGVGLNYNTANFFWDNTNTRLGIGTNTPSYRFQVLQTSSASIQRGSHTELQAGYTGSGRTEAMLVLNNVAGTGQNLNTPAHNTGITVSCMGTTTGYNMGFRAVASGSSTLNAASEGDATTAATGVNIGGFFRAGQSSSANVGAMATLDLGATIPASVSTALHAGNGATSANIITGYDNTTVAFALFDGGNVAIGNGNVNDGSRLHVNGTTKFTGTVNHPSGLAVASGTYVFLVRNSSSLNYEQLSQVPSNLVLETITNTSAGTLSPAVNTHYFFTGTTSTWTLPAISGNTNAWIKVKNVGTGAITVNSNGGLNTIFTNAATNTTTVNVGSYIEFRNNGTFWAVE